MTELELALRYAPIMHMDRNDTIPLRAVGYTVFRESAPSLSFPGRTVPVPQGGLTVEYACYFDYDIGHMYDLEHVWVMVDADGRVADAQGSFHGKYLNVLVPGWPGSLPPEDGHVQVFCQPGKHAFLAAGELTRLFPDWDTCCSRAEGPVLIGNPFCAAYSSTGKDLFVPSAEDNALSSRFLREELSFTPSLHFRPFRPDASLFMPWPELYRAIPGWIRAECARLRERYHRRLIIFTDIGDTIIDERTEEYEGEVVQRAACIPGARETYLKLHEAGFTICMVADGLVRSFHNTMEQHGLDGIFSAWVISEEVGEDKPSPRMFRAAMDALCLTDADKARVIMVGNNVRRDIPGANRFGLRSVLLDWSTRRPYDISGPDEEPDYRIHRPEELYGLALRLDAELTST